MTERLAKTAAAGSRVTTLQAVRDRLAAQIDDCTDERALPNLVLRLTDVLAQIDSLPEAHPMDAADVIAERRRQRFLAEHG